MKTLVTGGTGMVGTAFRKYEPDGVVRVGSSEYDLTDFSDCIRMLQDHKPTNIIHLAAKVGGVKGNTDYVGDFYRTNLQINTNVLDAALMYKVDKVVSLLSTCVYPDSVEYPLTEDQIHNGAPHVSNFGYAYAKRMLDVQSRAYRKQYGCNFVTAVPNNLFGENDNFDLENGHVIPAIIRKAIEAKRSGEKSIKLWGDGTPLREFTYSEDIADILMFLLREYDGEHPVNIGNIGEITIKDIAQNVCNFVGFHGIIEWDTNMPSGQYRKPSSNQRLLELGWRGKYTDMHVALKKTCDWAVRNYPNIRGVK